MKIVNETDLVIDLSDLINREKWQVENGLISLPIKLPNPLEWTVRIRWTKGKHPFGGNCNPSKKKIMIALNPRNTYAFKQEFAIGTKQTNYGYEYILETITFNNANDLARFIFLHEFSHLLDHLLRHKLQRKQTKANRFAFKYWKETQNPR